MNEENGKPSSDQSVVAITAEIVRQIDLALPNPKEMAIALAKRLRMSEQQYTMHELFWFSIFNCVSFAVNNENHVLVAHLKSIIDEMVGAHYAYHAVRLDLVKPVSLEEAEK